MIYNLVYNMIPVAKGRPRFTRHGFAFTPKKTRDAEDEIRQLTLSQWHRKPLEGPLSVSAAFFMPVPPSWSRKKREAAYGAWHTSRPDLDNIFKLCTDSLLDIVMCDDSQISEAIITKRYSGTPRIELVITEL